MKRRWLIALLVSTVFHGALVLGVRSAIRAAAQRFAPPTLARQTAEDPAIRKPVEFIRIGLRETAPTADQVAPVKTAPGQVEPVETAPVTGTGQVEPVETAPVTGTGQVELVETAPVTGTGQGEPVETAPVTGPGQGQGEPVETAPSQGTPSPEVLALVHARLVQNAARCYPPAAKRFRQSGVATVSFCTTVLGTIGQVTVDASSGSALLDHAATDCVVPSASPLPVEAARACFRLPVRFGNDLP